MTTHLSEHAVANKPAHSARLRLLYDTGYGRRRLYRRSDSCHGDREGPTEAGGTRTHPSRDDLPDRYLYLLDWYEREYDWRPDWTEERDPILAMVGLGKEIRASDRMIRPPDAIRLACAAEANIDLFIANDDRLSRKAIPGVRFISSLERAFL